MKLSILVEDKISVINRIVKVILNAYRVNEENDRKLATEIAGYLYEADPTPNKKFIPFIINLFLQKKIGIKNTHELQAYSQPVNPTGSTIDYRNASERQLLLPEDLYTIRERLDLIDRNKQILTQSTWEDGSAIDLNLVNKDYRYLSQLVQIVKEKKGVKRGGGGYQKSAYPGASIIAEVGSYIIYYVPKLSEATDKESTINALKDLGLGTDWCTRRDYKHPQTERYLTETPIYVIYNDGKPLIQCNFEFNLTKDILPTILDIHDNPTSMPRAVFQALYASLKPEEKIVSEFINDVSYEEFDRPSFIEYVESRLDSGAELDINACCAVYLKLWTTDLDPEADGRTKDKHDRMAGPIFEKLLGLAAYSEERVPAVEQMIFMDQERTFYDFRGMERNRPIQKDILQYMLKINSDDVMPIEEKWPEAAQSLLESPRYAVKYAINFLEARWVWAEENGAFSSENVIMAGNYAMEAWQEYRKRFGVREEYLN